MPHLPRHAHSVAIVPSGPSYAVLLDRPAFVRPDEDLDSSTASGVALTHAVRARARPPVAPPGRAARIADRMALVRPTRGHLIAAVVGAVVLGLGVASFLFWPSAGRATAVAGPTVTAALTAATTAVPR